jgi:hypothetical protein
MKLRPRDVVSYQGRDWIVEGVCTYKIAGKSYPLARAVEGGEVRFIEPLLDDADDRILMLHEIHDLQMSTPPPSSLAYKGRSYLPRLSGAASCEITGTFPGRTAGNCEIWRYRAAGDLYLQIERWPDRVVTLAGESVNKGMLDVLPGG